MTWPTGRAPSPPPVDWRMAFDDMLRHHAPDGPRCRSCGRLPEGMDPVLHQATGIFNMLVQRGVISVYDRPPLGDAQEVEGGP